MVEMLSMYLKYAMLIIGMKQHMQTGGCTQNVQLINWWVSGVENFSWLGKKDWFNRENDQ